MAPKKKTTKKKVAKKTSKKPAKKQPPEYDRDWLIQKHIAMVESGGDMAAAGSMKELRSMLGEEAPDEDLDVRIMFVEITFPERDAVADDSTGVML